MPGHGGGQVQSVFPPSFGMGASTTAVRTAARAAGYGKRYGATFQQEMTPRVAAARPYSMVRRISDYVWSSDRMM